MSHRSADVARSPEARINHVSRAKICGERRAAFIDEMPFERLWDIAKRDHSAKSAHTAAWSEALLASQVTVSYSRSPRVESRDRP
jgi:hypothetical protein